MTGEALSERQTIERQILALRRGVHEHLAANDGDTANRLLDEIAKLDRKLSGAETTAPEREQQ
jgi:hypothetical protein